jgi:Zn-finger nucleic acid-binding protein
MIHCPKCGVSTELRDGGGVVRQLGLALVACPSCGVQWTKFLESMVNNALWPAMVQHDKHDVICPKCRYERTDADKAIPRNVCPKCSVFYSKVLEAPRIIQKPTNDPQNIHQNADSAIFDFAGRDEYLDQLRNHSRYPTFRYIAMIGPVVLYVMASCLILFGVWALWNLRADYKYELGDNLLLLNALPIILGFLIGLLAKAIAEAFQMGADVADAMVYSSSRLNWVHGDMLVKMESKSSVQSGREKHAADFRR